MGTATAQEVADIKKVAAALLVKAEQALKVRTDIPSARLPAR
jgi:hypothetical protein